MLEQIFVEFPGRVLHAPASDAHDADSCPICADVSSGESVLASLGDSAVILRAKHPYVPGHLLVVPRQHFSDLARAPPELGDAFFSALADVSRVLGGKHWILANVGWVAGQSVPHFVAHILPDPWHIPEDFVESADRFPSFDPLTDVFTDGIRFKKFHVRYGDAHMTGVIVKNFQELKRAVGKMRSKFGRMRSVLHHERSAMLEAGHVPHVGYHLLILNYNGPQFVVIPRVFLPKVGRWGALELLYNADLSRDLEGAALDEFWEAHLRASEDLARQILK